MAAAHPLRRQVRGPAPAAPLPLRARPHLQPVVQGRVSGGEQRQHHLPHPLPARARPLPAAD